MNNSALLLLLGGLPLVGAVVVALVPQRTPLLAKQLALVFSLATLGVAIVMCAAFDPKGARFQFTRSYDWIPQFGTSFAVGADGIALVLLALTAILVPVVVLASWHDADPVVEAPAAVTASERQREPALVGAGTGAGPGAVPVGGSSRVEDQQGGGDSLAGLGGADRLPPRSRRSVPTFFALLLLLETALVGVFAATDVFLFYVFFEAMLVPMYFLIGSYGGPRRQYAAVKFFLYSLLGGLLMLAAVIALYVVSNDQLPGDRGTFSFQRLAGLDIDPSTQRWLFLGFFVAFAIKAPLFPFHTWLPDAGAEAPVGAAVLLVGVLDKVGTFGMIRYCLPLFPDAAKDFAPLVYVLSLVGIFYGALLAMGQRDLKRLVSYTSVAHFGFIALGVFAFTTQSMSGAVLYMVNHGFSTGALFLVVGFLIARTGSRRVDDYGGVTRTAPVLAGAFLVAGLSSLALPGTNSFVSEFLVLVGTFTVNRPVAVIATVGIILAALYILLVYQRTMHGPLRPGLAAVRDLTAREVWVIAPVLAIIVALGVYPKPVLDVINPAVDATMQDIGKQDPQPSDTAGANR